MGERKREKINGAWTRPAASKEMVAVVVYARQSETRRGRWSKRAGINIIFPSLSASWPPSES